MIFYYKTVDGKIIQIEKYEDNCWINCVYPQEEEINYLQTEFDIEPDFLNAAMDPEENSRIEVEGDSTLIIMDSPFVEKSQKNFIYYTVPMSIIITPKNIITISLRENSMLEEFSEGLIRSARTENRTDLALRMMLRMAGKYLQYLNQIDKIVDHVEEELKKSMRNKELIQLLEIEKSLVYFSASLRLIDKMLFKLDKGRFIELSKEDKDVLEDVTIEIKQAMEMSEIYLNILVGTMDAFSSIISNNLNVSMKRLASITLILSIPTIVTGYFGMNHHNLPGIDQFWIAGVACAGMMLIAWLFLKKTKMF